MKSAPKHKRRHSGAKRVDVSQSLSGAKTREMDLPLSDAQKTALAKLGHSVPQAWRKTVLLGQPSLTSREKRLTLTMPQAIARHVCHQWLKDVGAKRLPDDASGLWRYSVSTIAGCPRHARVTVYESLIPMVSASSGHECPVGRRVNTGSKPSRERRHDDRPNANEVDRPEATTDPSPDAVERIPMPLGGVKERDRIARHRD